MRHTVALVLVLIVVPASPAAADVFDFLWTSTTTIRLGQSLDADVAGGTIVGRDPAAMWDSTTSTLRWTFDGRTFGGTLTHVGDREWFGPLVIPSHPDFVANAVPPANATAPVRLVETDTGFEAGGQFGSRGTFVSFHGTGTWAGLGGASGSIVAFEPSGALLAALGLAAALGIRRRACARISDRAV
jgi:hypothetical protein